MDFLANILNLKADQSEEQFPMQRLPGSLDSQPPPAVKKMLKQAGVSPKEAAQQLLKTVNPQAEQTPDQLLNQKMRSFLDAQKSGIGTLEDEYSRLKAPTAMNPIVGILAAAADTLGSGQQKMLPQLLQNQTAQNTAFDDKKMKYLENIQKARDSMSKEEISFLGKQIADKKLNVNDLENELLRSKIYKNYASADHANQPKDAKDLKDTQIQSATYGKRIAQAEDVFSDLENIGYDRGNIGEGTKDILSNIPGMGNFTSENLKRQKQAERNFVTATLRKESGAAISNSEFKTAENQYFPRAGDTPEVLAQKRANRMQVQEGMKLGAGRAWEQLPQVKSEIGAGTKGFPKKVSNGSHTATVSTQAEYDEAVKEGFK